MPMRAKAVLFDVDGTLLRVGGAGALALAHAAAEVFGPLGKGFDEARAALGEMDFRGCTDALIYEELARRLGVDLAPHHSAMHAAYLRALDVTLAQCKKEIMPGVRALLAELAEQPHVSVGLLTGNIREGARKKLATVGLSHLVDCPGGFAEDGRERHEVARVALARMAAAAGVTADATVVVGDTEHDVAAAKRHGAHAVAVATGWTPKETLDRCGAELVLDSLSDARPLLSLLLAI